MTSIIRTPPMREKLELAGPLGGLRIVTNDLMVDGPFEDWSRVRSPSRAKRRRARGHPQRIRIYYTPSKKVYQMGDALVCHSAMYCEIERLTRARAQAGAAQ